MVNSVTIALDAMSGDNGLDVVIPAAIDAIKQHANLRLILVGDTDAITTSLQKYDTLNHPQLKIHPASQIIAMDESPTAALRYKKDSSMRIAVNLVKEGEAQACVSAGNTGALMAIAHFVLKTLTGIKRPAIMSDMPTRNHDGCVRMLDLGANVDVTPEMLFQFAVMGSVLTAAVTGIKRPKIALLNIGEEEIKGNEVVKKAAGLLSQCEDINYVGFVEGNDILTGVADVIVCDGFVGNVALKAMEGVAKYIGYVAKKAFHRNLLTKLAGACALFVLKPLIKHLNPEMYNGANFIGLRSIVIKSHGGVTAKGFEQAIERAIITVEKDVPNLIEYEVTKLLGQ
jgi:glycerol-3-phosphate acyltransferase PlsX